jgi:hypothetical protein
MTQLDGTLVYEMLDFLQRFNTVRCLDAALTHIIQKTDSTAQFVCALTYELLNFVFGNHSFSSS